MSARGHLEHLIRRIRNVDALEKLQNQYLALIQDCLTGTIYGDRPLDLFGQEKFDPVLREYGRDWPSHAHTMIGRMRLENLRLLVESVLGNRIPGDLIETGVWRGGACILMRAVLYAHLVTDRRVWVADSFAGVPAPDSERYPADEGADFHTYRELAVDLETVKSNFSKYGLLDEQVVFLEGFFKDTLPSAPIERLALLRLDGDLYESTIIALDSLYDKLSPGGYVIVDDYHMVEASKRAVDDFFSSRGKAEQIIEIDGKGVYWQKTAD